MKFVTKASTLSSLEGRVKAAKVLPQWCVTASEWQKDAKSCLKQLQKAAWYQPSMPVVVRSSAKAEDTNDASLAGHFISRLNVIGEDVIAEAVGEVIASFGDKAKGEDSVFIQPMLQDVSHCGVVFSCVPTSGAPYIVMNYDDVTGTTDTVTSGTGRDLTTFYMSRTYEAVFGDVRDQVVALVYELERLFENPRLDIEFARTGDGSLYLLQVRPLVMEMAAAVTEKVHCEALGRIRKKLASVEHRHPHLCGKRAIYGVMPDWNPAEIIGIRPRPLALSLYREVVTDAVWAYQRDNYGYRNLRSFPLLVEFEGLPYIDVRVSFNSFIPKSLPDDLAEKLVNDYLDRLEADPALHDKIEFDVVYSCYDFTVRERLKKLLERGFSEEEVSQVADSLLQLTNHILHHQDGLWRKDQEKIGILRKSRKMILESDLPIESRLYWLIEDCKRYGTLPFAGLARAGFIAINLLRSLRDIGIFSEQDYHQFLGSLKSVARRIQQDRQMLSDTAFMKKYGHLRPGTYDILSPRYDNSAHLFPEPDEANDAAAKEEVPSFAVTMKQLRQIESQLSKEGLDVNALQLLEFIKGAIEAREYAKFVFTRSLSDFLKLYTEYCAELGISREDGSFTHVQAILSLNSISSDPKMILGESIRRRKERYAISQSIYLPPLITSADQVDAFFEDGGEPNFITNQRVVADTIQLTAETVEIGGKIVFIENADPGYDWIFMHDIKGFVTKYGGVNSHMAIRASELGIPAVIGSGKRFEQWCRAAKLEIDCVSKAVRVVGEGIACA